MKKFSEFTLAEKEAYLAELEAKGTGIDRPGTEVTEAQRAYSLDL